LASVSCNLHCCSPERVGKQTLDTDPANAPFGKAIGLRRQRLEVEPVELFEQRAAGDTEAPDRAISSVIVGSPIW